MPCGQCVPVRHIFLWPLCNSASFQPAIFPPIQINYCLSQYGKCVFKLSSTSDNLIVRHYRYMYYSVWGDPPMIVRAELDGSNTLILVRFSSWTTQGPTALAIDVDENILYWVGNPADPSLQHIDLHYPHSEIVYHILYSSYLHDPMGLALDAYYFYWTDYLLGNVVRARRNRHTETVELIPYQTSPRGVNIYNPDDVQGMEPATFFVYIYINVNKVGDFQITV